MLPCKIKEVKPRYNNSEQKFWITWLLMGMQLDVRSSEHTPDEV